MYASLGNIVFELLTSFDALSDKRETRYAELVLTKGKPNLQPTGEALVEFQMSIQFHIAFCNPEEEYLRLNNARVSGEVLPFIYGNGFNEGDFVITTLERTINQTDDQGNFIEISCNLALKEFNSPNSAARELEQNKKNAFAISSNRPLPVKSNPMPDNPALSVCQENQQNKYATGKLDSLSAKVENGVNAVTDIDPTQQLIDKGQTFVDSVGTFSSNANTEIGKANNALGSMSAIIGAYAGITNESPTLPAKITAVQNSLTAVSVQLTALGTLPAIIGNVTDAQTALTAMVNTLNLIKTLNDNSKALNDACAPIAKLVAMKKPVT